MIVNVGAYVEFAGIVISNPASNCAIVVVAGLPFTSVYVTVASTSAISTSFKSNVTTTVVSKLDSLLWDTLNATVEFVESPSTATESVAVIDTTGLSPNLSSGVEPSSSLIVAIASLAVALIVASVYPDANATLIFSDSLTS